MRLSTSYAVVASDAMLRRVQQHYPKTVTRLIVCFDLSMVITIISMLTHNA